MRRTIRGAALAVGALALLAGPGAVAPAQATGPDVLPITVANQTGLGDAVHLYVLGTDLASGKLGWVDGSGAFHTWPAGSNPPSPAPDVSINGTATGGSTTVKVPRGFSGRIYFSFGDTLPFSLTPDGLVQPAPWASGDPTADILFDWSELTYNDAGLWINSSQVDMFAVPHAVSVTGSDGRTSSTGQMVDGGRDQVVAALQADPAWASTVVTRDDGTVLRVLAPGKAAGAGLLDTRYLDPAIATAWTAYTTRTLTVSPFKDQPSVTYTGRTSGGKLRFTDTRGTEVAAFSTPSSADVWGCDGALAAPNDQVVGPIARTLCAALNRGTLGTSTVEPVTDGSQFYRSSPVNLYAKAVHAAMVDGRAYAFAFDDVGAFESLVHSGDPTSARIDLSPLTGATGGGDAGAGAGDAGTGDGGTGDDGTVDDGAASGTGKVAVISAWNGKCLDVPAWNFGDGVRVQLWDCAGSSNQQWQMVDGTIRTQNGQCLDVAWGPFGDGAPVQIANCSGNPAQEWVLTDAGDLVNPQAGRCLDVTDWNGANGALLQIWSCAGTANQKWATAAA
ncbi:beta-1,3-glucanase family protein [Cellulomonas soli]|uniref:beta-1,3-glucanase family protein n=1 Tax=Cellulomonas soli TaxID=931535 RepID=UPI003F84BF30